MNKQKNRTTYISDLPTDVTKWKLNQLIDFLEAGEGLQAKWAKSDGRNQTAGRVKEEVCVELRRRLHQYIPPDILRENEEKISSSLPQAFTSGPRGNYITLDRKKVVQDSNEKAKLINATRFAATGEKHDITLLSENDLIGKAINDGLEINEKETKKHKDTPLKVREQREELEKKKKQEKKLTKTVKKQAKAIEGVKNILSELNENEEGAEEHKKEREHKRRK